MPGELLVLGELGADAEPTRGGGEAFRRLLLWMPSPDPAEECTRTDHHDESRLEFGQRPDE
jgi:hypothetical protein